VRIVVDANILVAELLRERGQALIASPALELYIAEKAWSETQHALTHPASPCYAGVNVDAMCTLPPAHEEVRPWRLP
jgi:predicted nucleic acid-binding protein